jgi:diketogulonate reductase-like aldo/keto reductase
MKNGIYLEAYAPLMSHHIKDELLNDEDVAKIAKKHNASNAQIAIAFLAHRDIIVIPKSVTPKRIDENLKSMDITLDEEDYKTLRAINRGRKFFTEPDNVDY